MNDVIYLYLWESEANPQYLKRNGHFKLASFGLLYTYRDGKERP